MSSNIPNSEEDNSEYQFIININNNDEHSFCNCVYCSIPTDAEESNSETPIINNNIYYPNLQYTNSTDIEINNENLDLMEIISFIYSYNRELEEERQLNEVLERSMDDLQLQRQDNVEIDIERQSYSLTDKKTECCCICMEKYKEEDIVSVLKCEHNFHSACIEEWGHYKASCPICKEEIESGDDKKDLESNDIVE